MESRETLPRYGGAKTCAGGALKYAADEIVSERERGGELDAARAASAQGEATTQDGS